MVDSFKGTIKDNFRKYNRIMQELLKVQTPVLIRILKLADISAFLLKTSGRQQKRLFKTNYS